MVLNILVTGATGYVGRQLIPRLLQDGHAVRGLARDASRVTQEGIEVVEGDADSGAGLPEAMTGIDVVYFLIHSMEGTADFGDTEQRTAEHVVDAARAAGVRRVVYLGGIVPQEDRGGGSAHLTSRRDVERQLLDGFPEGVALRASLVIGAGSRSFDFLASITERMPVLALPAWRSNRTAPVDARDAVEYLAQAATLELPTSGSAVYDIGGPHLLSYGEMVTTIAQVGHHERPTFGVPVSITPVAARVAAFITGEDVGLIEPLMHSLEYDLLPDTTDAMRDFDVRPRLYEDSVAWALRERAAAAA